MTKIIVMEGKNYGNQLKCNSVKNQRYFGYFFLFFESKLNFEYFLKKYGPYSLRIFQVIVSERHGYYIT